MKQITAIAFILLLTACMPIPDYNTAMKLVYNVPSSGTSQFDGTKHIRMSDMSCSSLITFELYQDTLKSKEGVVLLRAGSRSIDNIANGKSLLIKLDGALYSFKPTDALTKHETTSLGYGFTRHNSYKTYIVPESFVRQAAASTVFLSKIYFLDNSYIEGKCSTVTLDEQRELNKKINLGLSYEVTQKGVDAGNKFAAINGFREFVNMMDATKW